ncbi:GDSL family lipase [Rhodococcus sp. RS1C4]|nr:GDSL family lipase [Rhodococcus sp. RS1C4]
MAAPTDAVSAVDQSLTPMLAASNQTFRVVITPHRGGESVRIHLTNRFRPVPIEFARVSVAKQSGGPAVSPESARDVTFDGRNSVTAAPGADVVSDPIGITFEAWEPLSVSVYIPGQVVLPTEHFNGNATSFYSPPGSGDRTADMAGTALNLSTTSVPLASAVDVESTGPASTVVTFGDSITDGYSAGDFFGIPNPLGFPSSRAAVDSDMRYPDFLQRRIDDINLPVSVANAGVSGNRVVANGLIPQFTDSMVARLDRDVLSAPSLSDVIVLGGTNDIGMPIGATFEQVVQGYMNLIDRIRGAGAAVHLGTIPPSSNALLDGILTLPYAEPVRMRLNEWIRTRSGADSVVDFDAALRDPNKPSVMFGLYAGGDNLHPSARGYEAMADAVDLSKLRGAACTQ